MSDLNSKKTYAERKTAKEINKNSITKQRSFKKILSVFVWLLIIIFFFYGLYLLIKNNQPKSQDFSRLIPIVNRNHINIGSQPPGEYSSNPPTSGWHYPQTARVDFYEEAVADQLIIHNLEHGDIWISYRSDVSDEIKSQLKNLAGNKVIVTLRDTNNSHIALAAWGRLDSFNQADFNLNRVQDFIKRYKNRGPENISPTIHGI